jgi:hypothetical protein
VRDGSQLIETVRDAATRFRTALEQGGLSLPSLSAFPNGSCGDVSELLGQYFSDSGLGSWDLRSAMTSDLSCSHAWLEQDDLIVDITANQFSDMSEPVLVTKDRTWHNTRFPTGSGRKIASLAWFEASDYRAQALSDYETLKQRADLLR